MYRAFEIMYVIYANQPWFVAKVMEQTSRDGFIKIYTLFNLKTYFLNGIFQRPTYVHAEIC